MADKKRMTDGYAAEQSTADALAEWREAERAVGLVDASSRSRRVIAWPPRHRRSMVKPQALWPEAPNVGRQRRSRPPPR